MDKLSFTLLATRAKRLAGAIDKSPAFTQLAIEELPSLILTMAGGVTAQEQPYTLTFQWVLGGKPNMTVDELYEAIYGKTYTK